MDQGFQILERIIKTSVFRHKVLASNIANVDTPGYKTKDVSFKEVMANPSIKLVKTASEHIQGADTPSEVRGGVIEDRAPWEDGNNVALDMELGKMTENSLLYESGVKLLSKKLQMYKNAIRGR